MIGVLCFLDCLFDVVYSCGFFFDVDFLVVFFLDMLCVRVVLL